MSKCMIVLLATCMCSIARAQTDAALLFKPWEHDQRVEGHAEVRAFPTAQFGPGSDLDLSELHSTGRWRFGTKEPLEPTVGFEMFHLAINDSSHQLPGELEDVAVAGASPVMRVGEHAALALSAGIGYAGDKPFGNGRAWYGKAGIFFAEELDEDRALLFAVEYDANRDLFPDIPLPGIAYSFHYQKEHFVLGFPINAISWQPNEKLELKLLWDIPDSLEAEANYHFSKKLGIFARYEDEDNSFWVRQAPGHDRLFFLEQRAEVGIDWNVRRSLHFLIAGGYAFGRSFETGFDVRDLHKIGDVSDEPYLRVGVEISD